MTSIGQPLNGSEFEGFVAQVRVLLEATAAEKSYSRQGPDGQNRLYEFVQSTVGGPGHAAGEIIYKVRRYMAKRHPDDLLKIAAWAFLMYKHHSQ